jgi:hypothetical protein
LKSATGLIYQFALLRFTYSIGNSAFFFVFLTRTAFISTNKHDDS